MPFDSKGRFSRLHNWEQDRLDDIDIVTDHHDEEDNNFSDGLSQTFLRNGLSVMEADFNAGAFKIKNLGDGNNEKDAVNRGQLDKVAKKVSDSFLIGDLKSSIRLSDHTVWMICDGRAVSRTEFKDLFAIISVNFGIGDGSTTFNIPNYKGKFLRGLGGDSAKDMYTTQKEGLPNITGQTAAQDGYLRSPPNSGAFKSWVSVGGSARTGDGGNTASYGILDASASNPIYGANEHVTPLNQAVNIFIKMKEEA